MGRIHRLAFWGRKMLDDKFDKYNQALLNTKERVFVSLLTIESGVACGDMMV